jgi:UDP-3-O-[3-hydroxymyristoyl] glucosamine N-acyltransferase
MTVEPLYVAGTGSFAAEVAGWAAEAGNEIAGLIELEDVTRVGTEIHGLAVVALDGPPEGARAVLGTGGDRRARSELLAGAGWSPAGLVHPRAHLAATAQVAGTATIGPMAVVGAEAAIGEQVVLSRGVLVGHHARIGEFATLNPGVNVGGNARIGARAFLGMGCVIANSVRVGEEATVAAGAVSLREVSAGIRVQGVPAVPYEGP